MNGNKKKVIARGRILTVFSSGAECKALLQFANLEKLL